MDCNDFLVCVRKHYNRTGITCPLYPLFNCDLRYFGLKGMPEYGPEFLGGHFQLNTGLSKPVRGATSSFSFRCQYVNYEKDPADPKEQDEEWQFENEQ